MKPLLPIPSYLVLSWKAWTKLAAASSVAFGLGLGITLLFVGAANVPQAILALVVGSLGFGVLLAAALAAFFTPIFYLFFSGFVNRHRLLTQPEPTDDAYEFHLFCNYFESDKVFYPGTVYFGPDRITFHCAKTASGNNWKIPTSPSIQFVVDEAPKNMRNSLLRILNGKVNSILVISSGNEKYKLEIPHAKDVRARLENYYWQSPAPKELEASTANEIDWVATWRQKRAEDSHPTAS